MRDNLKPANSAGYIAIPPALCVRIFSFLTSLPCGVKSRTARYIFKRAKSSQGGKNPQNDYPLETAHILPYFVLIDLIIIKM